jgi:hypothetical protein
MFSQWVAGQPWWLTLLLLPAIVLAAVVVRVVHYGLIAAGAGLALAMTGGLIWMKRRSRR